MTASKPFNKKKALALAFPLAGAITVPSAALALTGQSETPTTVAEPATTIDNVDTDLAAMAAYWEAGYNYGQLVVLADAWQVGEFEAKITAGEMILAGDTSAFDAIVAGVEDVTLPDSADDVAPDEEPAINTEDGHPDMEAMAAFWAAGYNYGQLLALVDAWEMDDEFEAKIAAGEMILAGDTSAFDAIVAGVEDVEYVESDH